MLIVFWKYFKRFYSQKLKQKTKKTGLNDYAQDFSVHCNIIDISDAINIHKYFIKYYNIK